MSKQYTTGRLMFAKIKPGRRTADGHEVDPFLVDRPLEIFDETRETYTLRYYGYRFHEFIMRKKDVTVL